MTLEKRFYKVLQELVPQKTSHLVIACSGGVDSVALLRLMTKVYPAKNLSVCYVNHNQRVEAVLEEELLDELCKKLGLPFQIQRLHLKTGASENDLRKHRYLALKSVAQKSQAFGVLLAHHAQDNLETYLFRLIRGSHPTTIKGIARISEQNGLLLLRPMLEFWKSEIVEWAAQNRLSWIEDASNEDLRFARNGIRKELLPLLEKFRPRAHQRVLSFFSELELSQASEAAAPETCAQLTSGDGVPILDISFGQVKTAVDSLLGEASHRTTKGHWESVKRQLEAKTGEKKVIQFPGNHQLLFLKKKLYWQSRPEEI